MSHGKAMRVATCLVAALTLGGCCNFIVRKGNSHGPYMCAEHPYWCTAYVWTSSVSAPWKLGNGPDGIWEAFATLTWPFWVVDEVCEAALDTVFLPVDATYACIKDGE